LPNKTADRFGKHRRLDLSAMKWKMTMLAKYADFTKYISMYMYISTHYMQRMANKMVTTCKLILPQLETHSRKFLI